MNTRATEAAPAAANVVKFTPKVVKQVSVNLLKLRAGYTVYVLLTGAMATSKPLKNQTAEDAKKEPPTLLPVINLETGEVQNIITGTVLKDLLNDEYPRNGYVGKSFWIAVKEQKEAKAGGGRRYNNYDVKEIETPDELKSVAAKAQADAAKAHK